MGLFDFLKGDEKPNNSGVSLDMNKEKAINTLNMRKEKVNHLCMKKSELSGVNARVGVAMDYSGSMSSEYKRGIVQDIVERLLPLALKFDDNGELDMWLFENGSRRLPTVTIDNFYQYVDREILAKKWHMGGTEYAPVMRDIMNKYINEDPSGTPTYIIFITDGDNSDKRKTEEVIRESSKYNIFWQFVGIGNDSFAFLQKLDDLKGRPIDNTDFFKIASIERMTDEDLYKNLLNEYPGWEKQARANGLIR